MLISVIVTSFNHAPYIRQSIEGVLAQQGAFNLEIILGDDDSTDGTRQILEEYQQRYPKLFRLFPVEKNLGVTRNLKRCLDACRGEYIAICEGDDYWTSTSKLQKQSNFLENNRDFGTVFSIITLYFQEGDRYILFPDQVQFTKDSVTINDLITNNIIGNFSCCMYRKSVVQQLPDRLFDLFTVDWMFNMACSELAKIGFIREPLSVYRKHSGGAWTGKPDIEQVRELMELIKCYDQYFDYRYHSQFERNLANLGGWLYARTGDRNLLLTNSDEQSTTTASDVSLSLDGEESKLAEVVPPEKDNATENLISGEALLPTHNGSLKDRLRPTWHRIIRLRNIYLHDYPILFARNLRTWLSSQYRQFRTKLIIWENDQGFRAKVTRQFVQFIRWAKAGYAGLRSKMTHRHHHDPPFGHQDLLILDTVFPNPLSPFRYHEFCSYLKHFPESVVLSNGEHLHVLGETRPISEVITDFINRNPEYAGRVFPFTANPKFIKGNLAYLTFLNNVKVFLHYLEYTNTPFIFTLYPGGGFELNQEVSDSALRRIFSSPQFRRVIVTQTITRDYLLEKRLCPQELIEFIYGVVSAQASHPLDLKSIFGKNKSTLDICFIAYRYTEKGIDKGYDVLVEAARLLCPRFPDIHFHVVGNFDQNTIALGDLVNNIHFYGIQKNEWLIDFYQTKDIILSPNVSFNLSRGAFDGFPTTSCTDAAFSRVAMFCTDDLHQNIIFQDGYDFVLIDHDPVSVAKKVEYYFFHPDELLGLAERGKNLVERAYSDNAQMIPRIQIIERELKAIHSKINSTL